MAPGTQAQGRHRLCALGLSLSARSLLPALLRGPALLPLGREKPEGGVSQRKRETKNSSPGEQAQSQSFSAFALGSGPEAPFLGLFRSPLPKPNHPLVFGRHCGPQSEKGPRVGDFCPSGHPPREPGKSLGLSSSWLLMGR